MLSILHVKTAEWVNMLDKTPGSQVWFNFRETKITHQRSYLARLNYAHQNPVKHKLVPVSNQYPMEAHQRVGVRSSGRIHRTLDLLERRILAIELQAWSSHRQLLCT